MSVSSIPSSPPLKLVNYLDIGTQQQQQQQPPATADNDATDAGAAQPTTPAPLPPGQGTRVNQLV
jgi:hypothetical protein